MKFRGRNTLARGAEGVNQQKMALFHGLHGDVLGTQTQSPWSSSCLGSGTVTRGSAGLCCIALGSLPVQPRARPALPPALPKPAHSLTPCWCCWRAGSAHKAPLLPHWTHGFSLGQGEPWEMQRSTCHGLLRLLLWPLYICS